MPRSDETKGSGESKYLRTAAAFVLVLFNLWHLAVEQVERREKKELQQTRDEIKAEVIAELKPLVERLDKEVLRKQEAKSKFDLFYEQYESKRSK